MSIGGPELRSVALMLRTSTESLCLVRGRSGFSSSLVGWLIVGVGVVYRAIWWGFCLV